MTGQNSADEQRAQLSLDALCGVDANANAIRDAMHRWPYTAQDLLPIFYAGVDAADAIALLDWATKEELHGSVLGPLVDVVAANRMKRGPSGWKWTIRDNRLVRTEDQP